MTRLIDTMDYDDLGMLIDHLASSEHDLNELEMREELEKLFKPAPHWSDNLNHYKEQTWVLCWLSNECPKETRYVGWVSHVNDHRYEMGAVNSYSWRYATPVDLNLRYGNGEDTL